MSARLLVAINPSASFGRARDAGSRTVELLQAAGHDAHAVVAPTWEGLAVRARDELPTGVDALIVVGGDGMVHLGASLVAGTETPLGIVPVGTGNDLAKTLRVPEHDVDAAVAALLDALGREPQRIDTGIAEWVADDGAAESRRFVGAVSCGFDAIVNERANAMHRPRGSARYTLAMLRELAVLRPIRYRVEHDGGVLELDGALVTVANNQSIGGGMRIAPDASLTDGLLDLFVVEALSRTAFLRLYPKVFRGEHVDDPRVHLIRTTQAVVHASARAPIVGYADGERLGPLPMRVRVEPGTLRLLQRPN